MQLVVLCVCLGTLCLSSPSAGQNRLLEDNGCLYSVEGNCIPRRTTYGYYPTHWRAWPYAQPRIPKVKRAEQRELKGSTVLPDAEVPRVKDEASFSPDLPTSPEEFAPVPQPDISPRTDPLENLRPDETPLDVPPKADTPAVETPLEDDLNIPPAEESGAVRLDRPSISQLPGSRSLPRTSVTGGRNPLRFESVPPPRAIPAQFMGAVPATRPVSHETRFGHQPYIDRLGERSAHDQQPISQPIVPLRPNPLRSR